MQDRHLYEYAVIRLVPRVEREEFLNVGIVVFCKKPEFLKARFLLNEAKLKLFAESLDCDQVKSNLTAFEKICKADKNAGPIGQLDAPERFRWLTAVRSSVIQTSRPHPGMSCNLEKTLNQLFEELVL